MNFDLTSPCALCPFRTDIRPFLPASRAEEICTSLVDYDQSFPCHKTLDYDGDGSGHDTPKTQHCAGALIMLEKLDRSNQLMRIAERIGCYDRHKLNMSAPVFDNPQQMIAAHLKEETRCLQSARTSSPTKKTRNRAS